MKTRRPSSFITDLIKAAQSWANFQDPDSLQDQKQDTRLRDRARDATIALRLAVERLPSPESSPVPPCESCKDHGRLRDLVAEAYPIMATHAARHSRKAARAKNGSTAQSHKDRSNTSNSWLSHAAAYYTPHCSGLTSPPGTAIREVPELNRNGSCPAHARAPLPSVQEDPTLQEEGPEP